MSSLFSAHLTPVFSLFPAHLTPGALSSVCWSMVKAAGLVSAIVAVGACLWAGPKVQRMVSFSDENNMDDSKVTCRLEPEAPASSSPPPVKVKKKKSVKFDLDRNETVEVGDWYVRTWGTGDSYAGVRWGEQLVWTVDRYLEPCGYTQLHFPQTKWIRDVPGWDAENDDGDIEMIDV